MDQLPLIFESISKHFNDFLSKTHTVLIVEGQMEELVKSFQNVDCFIQINTSFWQYKSKWLSKALFKGSWNSILAMQYYVTLIKPIILYITHY